MNKESQTTSDNVARIAAVMNIMKIASKCGAPKTEAVQKLVEIVLEKPKTDKKEVRKDVETTLEN